MLRVPKFDSMGDVKQEAMLTPQGQPLLDAAGQPVTKPLVENGTIIDILDFVMMDFPRAKMTMKHITEASRLLDKLAACREQKATVLELEDAQHEWLMSVLRNDEVGVKMFGLNLPNILAAVGGN